MFIFRASALASLGLAFLCHASPLNLDTNIPANAPMSRLETRAVDTAKDAPVLPKLRPRDDGADETELVGVKIKSRDEGAELKVKTREDEDDGTELIGLKLKI